LPREVRADALQAYRQFQSDPAYPGLEFKLVDARDRIYSARVGRRYRALGAVTGDRIIWFWIGRHAAYDRLLSRYSH
jgi:hypothetical protein